jgi:glycosyltransferase involved in cell wall biosynthesis
VTETWAPAVNGIVTRLRATIRELRRRGHDVLVLAPSTTDPELEGVEVRTLPSLGLPFIYGGQPWGLPLPRSRRFLEGFHPDVVHVVNPVLLGWAGVIYSRTHGLPLVCSYHTHVAKYAHHYGLGFLEQPIWALITQAHLQAHVNLAASPAASRELEEQGVPDVEVWSGAVDLTRFHPSRQDPPMRSRMTGGHPDRRLLLFVGRLAAEKGIQQLLPLVAEGSGRHLALVGDGPARAELEAMFGGANVTFMGTVLGGELAAAYASADLFAFPSTTDTFGLVLLEAMASGLPVLAASSRPSAELLAGAPAAALFDSGDEAGMIAAATRLLASGADRVTQAAHARRRAPTWEQTTTELLEQYESAIAIHRGHRCGVSA